MSLLENWDDEQDSDLSINFHASWGMDNPAPNPIDFFGKKQYEELQKITPENCPRTQHLSDDQVWTELVKRDPDMARRVDMKKYLVANFRPRLEEEAIVGKEKLKQIHLDYANARIAYLEKQQHALKEYLDKEKKRTVANITLAPPIWEGRKAIASRNGIKATVLDDIVLPLGIHIASGQSDEPRQYSVMTDKDGRISNRQKQEMIQEHEAERHLNNELGMLKIDWNAVAIKGRYANNNDRINGVIAKSTVGKKSSVLINHNILRYLRTFAKKYRYTLSFAYLYHFQLGLSAHLAMQDKDFVEKYPRLSLLLGTTVRVMWDTYPTKDGSKKDAWHIRTMSGDEGLILL